MNKFIKDNFVLVLGIFLPILVIVFFGLATIIPGYFVDPPKYDLVFMINNTYDQGLSIDVINGKATAQFRCDSNYSCTNSYNQQKIYRFSPQSKALQEISVQLPTVPDNSQTFSAPVTIPQLENLTLNTSNQSPDGYQFNSLREDGGSIFTGLFYGNYRPQLSISKNGYSISIPLNTNNYYYNIKFIGWVIATDNQQGN